MAPSLLENAWRLAPPPPQARVEGVLGMPERTGSDIEGRIGLLGQAPLFRDLADEVRLEVASRAHDRLLRRREMLFHEGDDAEETSVLFSGRLKITQLAPNGGEVLLRLVSPGEVCGGLGLPPGSLYPCSAAALQTSDALVWDQKTMAGLLERFPVLGRNALRIQSERLRLLEERYRELATERVPPRLARALVRLVGHVGNPCEGGVRVALTREELAQMVGTTLFTVSRLLSEWESRGLVLGRREAVVIRDLGSLAAFAEDLTLGEGRP